MSVGPSDLVGREREQRALRAVLEADESVTVVLSDPSSGLTITRPVGNGTIAADD